MILHYKGGFRLAFKSAVILKSFNSTVGRQRALFQARDPYA